MTLYFTCLLCANTGGKSGRTLSDMEEHVVTKHGYSKEDCAKTTKREREEGDGYIYSMPDGTDWLLVLKGGNYVGGI